MPKRPEIDDATFLSAWADTPGSVEKWDVDQAQIDHYAKAIIMTCVDQLEDSLEDNSGHKVHHWEVDGILRAIDILEMMVEGISTTSRGKSDG